jgi:hypothetical protein
VYTWKRSDLYSFCRTEKGTNREKVGFLPKTLHLFQAESVSEKSDSERVGFM